MKRQNVPEYFGNKCWSDCYGRAVGLYDTAVLKLDDRQNRNTRLVLTLLNYLVTLRK